MNIAAETFKERLKENNIVFQDSLQTDGNHYVNIECALKSAHMVNMTLIFTPDSEQVSLRSFRLVHVEQEQLLPIYQLLNQLNDQYAWVKFYLDSDNDVALAADAILTPRLAAHITWELLVRTLTILDVVHRDILKVCGKDETACDSLAYS